MSPLGEGKPKTGITQEKKQSGVRSVPQKGERTKTSGKEKEKEEKTWKSGRQAES